MPPWYITLYLIFHFITIITEFRHEIKENSVIFTFGDGEYIKIRDIFTFNNILGFGFFCLVFVVAPIGWLSRTGILGKIGNMKILKRK